MAAAQMNEQTSSVSCQPKLRQIWLTTMAAVRLWYSLNTWCTRGANVHCTTRGVLVDILLWDIFQTVHQLGSETETSILRSNGERSHMAVPVLCGPLSLPHYCHTFANQSISWNLCVNSPHQTENSQNQSQNAQLIWYIQQTIQIACENYLTQAPFTYSSLNPNIIT